jgi:hypothetical protein
LFILSSVVHADVPNGLYLGDVSPHIMPPQTSGSAANVCVDPDMGLKVWRMLKIHVNKDTIQDQVFDELDTHRNRSNQDVISGGFSYTEAIDGKLVELSNLVIRYDSAGSGGMSIVVKTKSDASKKAEACVTWITGGVVKH